MFDRPLMSQELFNVSRIKVIINNTIMTAIELFLIILCIYMYNSSIYTNYYYYFFFYTY